jgi:circadian clock protein KaiC
MTARVASGVKGLDTVLEGGFPANSINIVMGRPGTGKTILATALLFANASAERKGLYLGTVSEPLPKTIRYMQEFDFFRSDWVQDYVIFEDLSSVVRVEPFSETIRRIIQVVREQEASFLVIDSMRALHAFAGSPEESRRGIYELAAALATLPITAFWVGEYAEEDIDKYPEFAVADGVLHLVLKRVGVKDMRYLRVIKMRGTGFQDGEHAYRISQRGVQVYPRLLPSSDPGAYAVHRERAGTGLQVLDAMVEEGFWKGGSTVVFGPPGSGKTLLGLHFLFKGMESGEKGLLLSLQENPAQLQTVAAGFGWDLDKACASGALDVVYVSPVSVYIDEVILETIERAERAGVGRLVIDSLNDLEAAAGDQARFHDYMYALVQHMSMRGISLFMTSEVKDLFATSYLSEFGISHMSDNLVLLHYLRQESTVKRAIAVLKTRGSKHDTRIREFCITSNGFEIGEPFGNSSDFR